MQHEYNMKIFTTGISN